MTRDDGDGVAELAADVFFHLMARQCPLRLFDLRLAGQGDGYPPVIAVCHGTTLTHPSQAAGSTGAARVRAVGPDLANMPAAGDAVTVEGRPRNGQASGDPTAAARLLRQALDLWRGPALGEFADRPFAAAEAMRLEELREAALEDLFDAELALGHHHEVVGGLEALVASGPLRERRWGQLMLALYRDGRQAEALDAFGRLRQILAQDLGVDPGAELRRLHQAILQQSPRLGWRLPPRPAAGRGYFGRDREMSRSLRCFDEAAAGRGGVVLLAGEPGIGKSHALQLLADQARTSSAIVLAGRCVEGAWAPPFRPFAEAMVGYGELVGPQQLRADLGLAGPALARIAPRLWELLPALTPPSALQPDGEQFRLLDAAAQFFTAVSARAPVLLILDDLQWADAGTAMMLRHVARSCGHRQLLLAGALRFDEAAKTARDAAERIAQADGPPAAAAYLAGVTSALSTAGSSAHAWMLAPAGLAYAGPARDEAWAALTLLALDRKEATDPDYVGLPIDQPKRRQALTILYRSPRAVSRSVDLARYAVGAIYGRRDSVPAEAAQDPTVLLYLLGGLRPALPLFEEAAEQARIRGELAPGSPLPGEHRPRPGRSGRPGQRTGGAVADPRTGPPHPCCRLELGTDPRGGRP